MITLEVLNYGKGLQHLLLSSTEADLGVVVTTAGIGDELQNATDAQRLELLEHRLINACNTLKGGILGETSISSEPSVGQ